MAEHQRAVLALALALVTTCLAMTDLDGYELISARPNSEDQAAYLIDLQTKYPELDLWELPEQNRPSPFLVPPNLLDKVKELMRQQNIQWNVTSTDVAQLLKNIAEEDNLEVPMSTGIDADFHTRYHGVEQMREYLKALHEVYPKNMYVSHLKILTVEGKTIPVVKLSGTNSTIGKKAILIQGGIHAREWISPAVNFYAIEKMLKGYEGNEDWAKQMLDDYDWYFVPILNIDGYAYSRSHKRLWRKNRRQINNGVCYGVDLNRNFDSNHGTVGINKACRFENYPGDKPFSEPETRAYRDLFNSLKSRLVAQLTTHSYSQFIVVPWAYSPDGSKPGNIKELKKLALKMRSSIYDKTKKIYRVGTPLELFKSSLSGTCMDWTLSQKPGLYTYTVEMRPASGIYRPGFLLPADQIVPTGEELLAMLKTMSSGIKA